MNTEPVLTAAIIVSVVSSVILLGTSFGLPLTEEQRAAIMGLVVVLAPLIAGWWARSKVTPLVLPTDIDGERLTRSDNSPAIPEMAALQTEAKKINKEIDAHG